MRSTLNPVRGLPIAGLLIVSCLDCSGEAPGAVRAPVPRDLDRLDPLLVELVEEAAAAADAAPDDAESFRRLGMVYQANRLNDPAVEAYGVAVRLDPADARSWYGLGVSLANLGRAGDALAAFDRAATLTDYPPLAWRRGFLLLETGRMDEARAAFETALARDARDPAAHAGIARVDLSQGDAAAAIVRLEPLVTDGRGQDYLQHLLGLAYRQAGRPDDAAGALARGRNSVALWRDPWSDETLRWRRGFDWTLAEARRALADGRFDVALPTLERLRQLRPNDRDLLATLAAAYVGAGRNTDANEAIRVLGREHPDDYRAQYELSRFHDRGKRYRQALQHADRAIELNDAYAPAWTQKGLVLRHQKRFDECERAAARAVELTPDDGDAWWMAGVCRMELERWSGAAAAFERVVAAEHGRLAAWLRLAEAAAHAGDRARAAAALDRARAMGRAAAERADSVADELGLPRGEQP